MESMIITEAKIFISNLIYFDITPFKPIRFEKMIVFQNRNFCNNAIDVFSKLVKFVATFTFLLRVVVA